MKKLALILAAALIALSFASCANNNDVIDNETTVEDTTVEEIMQENELSTDYLENKTMLMIPVK